MADCLHSCGVLQNRNIAHKVHNQQVFCEPEIRGPNSENDGFDNTQWWR